MSSSAVANAFTVDVEEWFHIVEAAGAPARGEWDRAESRVERGTDRLLGILERAGVKATFFVLGWIAERHPDLLRRVAAAGHELASHGLAHDLIYEMTPERFREETKRAKALVEDVAGAAVVGYRAASFSITPAVPWAFDVLAELGFSYDSSIFPAPRAHGGFELDRRRPFRITGPAGGTLLEFPIVPLDLGPLRIPFAGGGYLRLLPLALVRAATRRLNARGIPVTYYVHPREVDPDQPRIPLPAVRRFQYYVNLAGTPDKLARLLDRASGRRFETLASLQRASAASRLDAPLRLSG
jgi:polysaccharide deacetylase family protein (PEP-CTERM system associated)